MSKKELVKEESIEEQYGVSKTFLASLEKKYGEGILFSGTEIVKEDEEIFKVSPNFDSKLGGVPEGSWVTFSGPSGCGKTTMGLVLAARMQAKGREIFYLDAEHRLKKMNLRGILGLDADKVHVIRSTKERQLTGEDFLQIGTDVLKAHPGCLLIIDSASALCPASEMTGEVSGSIRTSSPKMLGNFCRKNAGVVKTNKNIVFIVKHIITNTSGYGEKWLEDGGEKVKFQADIRVWTKGKPEIWSEGSGENKKKVGHIVEWEVLKSAIKGEFNQDIDGTSETFKTYIRYGVGVDEVTEYIQLGADYGIITVKGAWYYFGEQKVQGEANLREFFDENPDQYNKLKVQVDEIQRL